MSWHSKAKFLNDVPGGEVEEVVLVLLGHGFFDLGEQRVDQVRVLDDDRDLLEHRLEVQALGGDPMKNK